MAALVALSLAWAFAVWQSGAVSDVDRSVTLLLCGVAAVLGSYGKSARNTVLPRDRAVFVAFCVLMAWAAFALTPLPLDWLERLSPGRAAGVRAAARLDGALTAAPLAHTPDAAVSWLEAFAGAVTVLLLVRRLTWTRRGPWTIVIPIGAVAFLEAVLGLAQSMTGVESPPGSFVNRNHFGALLAVSLPFLAMPAAFLVKQQFSRDSDAPGGFQASLLVIASGVVLVAILFSQSRGAAVAAVCALAATAALLAARGLSGPRLWAVRGAMVAATFAAFVALAPNTLVQRFAEDRPEDATSGDRIQFWKETASLIRDYPVFGTGLGGYESGLQPYRRSALLWRVDYAHNDYLQVVAELGIPGAVAVALIVAILLSRVRRALVHPKGEEHHYLAVACAGAWVSILVVATTDFNLFIPANGMLFAWVGGISLGLVSERRVRSKAAVATSGT